MNSRGAAAPLLVSGERGFIVSKVIIFGLDFVTCTSETRRASEQSFVFETSCPTAVFKRILLKLSGEALAADQGFGVDTPHIHSIAGEIADVHNLGVQMAIVVGGGNFFRGVADQAKDMDRVSADHMGMLATVINALALQDALEKQNVYTRVNRRLR